MHTMYLWYQTCAPFQYLTWSSFKYSYCVYTGLPLVLCVSPLYVNALIWLDCRRTVSFSRLFSPLGLSDWTVSMVGNNCGKENTRPHLRHKPSVRPSVHYVSSRLSLSLTRVDIWAKCVRAAVAAPQRCLSWTYLLSHFEYVRSSWLSQSPTRFKVWTCLVPCFLTQTAEFPVFCSFTPKPVLCFRACMWTWCWQKLLLCLTVPQK